MKTRVNIFICSVHGFKGSGVQGFKVPFLSLDCIWDA